MKPQHQVFILQMIKHGDKLRAYRAAYPKAKGQSAIKAAERLLRIPAIADEISGVLAGIRYDAMTEAYKFHVAESKVPILSILKKRQILNQIATCEMKVGRYIKDGDSYRMVYEDPRPRDIIYAINTDCKLEDACNRMRDINDIKLAAYDIYIDGRPCNEPTAIPDPNIPPGLVMLPRKPKILLSENGNKKEQNPQNSPFEGGNPPQADRGMSTREEDFSHSQISGNKKEQNPQNSPFEGGNPPQADRGMSTRDDDFSHSQISGNPESIREEQTPALLSASGDNIEGLLAPNTTDIDHLLATNDSLGLKKQVLLEKHLALQKDPLSQSFYKDFLRRREEVPPPQVYTDEEIQAIINPKQEINPFPICGKMYFPEKKFMPGNED